MIIDRPRLPVSNMLTIGWLPSALKVNYYRLRGARIGKGVKIGFGSVIVSKDIEIGDQTTIGMFSCISCKKLQIGKRTIIRPFVVIDAQDISIGNDVTISEVALVHTMIASTQSKLILHDRVHIFPFSFIDLTRKVEIDEESCVGYGASIYTHSSYKSKLEGYPVEFGDVNIGKGVWISSRAFINQAVTIGDDAEIGTNSVVSKDVPVGMLAIGSPARVIEAGQFIANHTDQEKFSILAEILDEFSQYLCDFAGYTWKRQGSDDQPRWMLASRNKRNRYQIELIFNYLMASRPSITVVFNAISDAEREKWDTERRIWFSIGSRCCSAHLDDMGEELREYFKRYGIYFARP